MLFFKNREIQSILMANYVNTAIRAGMDGDPSAALAYYAAVLDMDSGNADARLGALIELQKLDWIYEEDLPEDARQAVKALLALTSTAINPDQTLSAKRTGFTDLGNWSDMFDVEYPYED